MMYFDRLSKHEQASDLLIANRVLLAADKRVFLSFFDGVLELTNVIAGHFVEEYLMRDLLLRNDVLNKFYTVLFLFVDLESNTYQAADPKYIIDHITKGPFKPNLDSTPGYIIDLSGLEAKPLLMPPARQ